MIGKSLVEGILQRDRLSLSKAITMIESTLDKDSQQVKVLFEELHQQRPTHQSLRIGLTGSPGVGKSTLIEALGTHLTDDLGKQIAILAVDPSSPMTGGSILGDKTRMPKLSINQKSYIRPSPSRGDLGGVVASSHDTIRLCEYAGFDVIMVESVGVGQSELCLADLSDIFVLLVAPGAGDELQGIKKGITELADMILVNKCESPLAVEARRTLFEYQSAMKFRKSLYDQVSEITKVLPISAMTMHGIKEAWTEIATMAEVYKAYGILDRKREAQRKTWAQKYALHLLTQRFQKQMKERLPPIMDGRPISTVAERMVLDFLREGKWLR